MVNGFRVEGFGDYWFTAWGPVRLNFRIKPEWCGFPDVRYNMP